MNPQDKAKQAVGYFAVDTYVRSGMKVGLGTGTTAKFVVERIGQRMQEGSLKDLLCVPTSEATRKQAESLGIPLTTLDGIADCLDVAIDGADEILPPTLGLVKGRGGALLREKMIAAAAKTFIVAADETKLVSNGIGSTGALPVEVVVFSGSHTKRLLSALPSVKRHGGRAEFRKRAGAATGEKNGGQEDIREEDRFVTDNGNYIVDLYFTETVPDLHEMDKELKSIPGVVETGFFLDLASVCLIGKADGSVATLTAERK
ncbi:ribulose 5-phosphate isomerase [Toxoplasma gondii ME49]|uniref:ribose-5-phosphate isomerase n=1 Tax=Toxoplasma gondii (strain ATCC 50611 / Me49) TaxID=508771 RepID=S8GQK2_TOXGM|nr:ribulose 5-phosphate isomerase [Toxoplasma gondii ME49]EPT30799.1 ribulose 5-phosphate isomerase [Toxoplasma gondii ME49]|eukprot:XP_002366571.1 ribulose 5-phosphate isomerase [Toxoplasma gondii ME49]